MQMSTVIQCLIRNLAHRKEEILAANNAETVINKIVAESVPIFNDTLAELLVENNMLAFPECAFSDKAETSASGIHTDAFSIIKLSVYVRLSQVARNWFANICFVADSKDVVGDI